MCGDADLVGVRFHGERDFGHELFELRAVSLHRQAAVGQLADEQQVAAAERLRERQRIANLGSLLLASVGVAQAEVIARCARRARAAGRRSASCGRA